MDSGATAKRAAREARSSPALRLVARGGYAANGVVHLLIGVIVLVVATGGRGQSDQSGAFRAIGAVPLGFVALWVLAILLWGLGVWHVADGMIARRGSAAEKWGARLSEWGQALVFLALGTLSASVALGARPDAETTAEQASRGVLHIPGGPWALGLVGLGIGIGGVAFIVMGLRRSFRTKLSMPSGALGRLVSVLGVVGFVAKGIALGIVAVLTVVAAVRIDPTAAGGLDGAVRALLQMFAGPFLVGIVGAGLVSYGVFCFFRARYARL